MRFGVCCGPDRFDAALAAGADYVEPAAFSLARDPSYAGRLKGYPVEATNVFFPGDLKLYDDEMAALAHAETVLLQAGSLGVAVCVIGSGAARRAPAEVMREWAEGRFVELVGQMNAVAEAAGVKLAPESLCRDETDVGNDLAALALGLREVGVSYTADSFHILKEWDAERRVVPLATTWVEQVPFAPAHVHLGPLLRDPPNADDPMLPGFFRRLKELGYDERISLEVTWEDFQREVAPAISAVRKMWENA